MGLVIELFMIQVTQGSLVKRLWELRLYIVMGLDWLLLLVGLFLSGYW